MPDRRARRLALALGLAGCAAWPPREARADAIEACTSAAVSGQRLQREGKLNDARARFLACVRPECPAEVRGVCEGLVSTADHLTPTVILGARDAGGQDLAAVRVLVDGAVALETLDGKALALDPGAHVLRFEHGGATPVELHVVLREAEKDRLITATFAPAPPPSTPIARAEGRRPVPPAVFVFAGAGVVALGGFTYLTIHGQSVYDACNPHACAQSTVDSLGVERGLAFAALGLGVASIGAATWLWLARPVKLAEGASLVLVPHPRGAGLFVTF